MPLWRLSESDLRNISSAAHGTGGGLRSGCPLKPDGDGRTNGLPHPAAKAYDLSVQLAGKYSQEARSKKRD